jgi:hypothetical protein
MKVKIVLGGLVLLFVGGLVAAGWWWARRPQIIRLDNGDQLTLVGVTYGRHHVPPAEKSKPAAGVRQRRGNLAFNTANNTLVVWIRQEHPANRWPNYQTYLYDRMGAACVGETTRRNSYGGGSNEIVGVEFDSFPRRSGKFFLRIQEFVPNTGQVMNEKRFVLTNPARGPFEKWEPEALPATKTDEDLSVTLTKLVAGAALPYQRNQDDPSDGMNKGVAATFTIQRNGSPVTNWQLVSVEASDATGNHANSGVAQSSWQDNQDSVFIQAGLWPDEPAWKTRLQFSQQSDFASNELWSVANLPLEAGNQQDFWNFNNNFNDRRSNTNKPVAEADVNGYHLKIYPAKLFSDQQQGNGPVDGGLHIQVTPSFSAGMGLTLIKVADNQGGEIQNNGSGTSGNGRSTFYSYQLHDLGGLTNLNVTLALHRDRFVEFIVKPAKAASDAQ